MGDVPRRQGRISTGAERERKRFEEALRVSEEKYRTLTENITVGIFRSTPGAKGRFLEANAALVRMLGYDSREDLFAEDVAQIYVHPEDRKVFSDKISLTGFLKNEELLLKQKGGAPIIVSETAIAVRGKDGKILYFDGIVEDITERKKSEEALRIQKTFLEILFNSAPEAIVLHDNHDRIVNVNEEFVRMFGYAREEAIGRPINDVVAPDSHRDEASHLSDAVIHGDRVEAESQRRKKDGTLIDVSILGAPIVDQGTQMGVYAIYRDITERKRSQEDLRLQKTYFERLFNSAPEAIVLHDNEDRIVDVNEEFTNLFGYSRDEAIGRPINSLVAPENLREEANLFSDMVIRGERVEADSVRRRKDGSLIDVWILGAPIRHGGKQIGVYAIYRDITERKKAAEARIRAAEEARMARNIQLNFLPKSSPSLPGYDVAGRSIPALNVGGDYFDFIELDDHRLAVGLGDVSGNGLPAALVMANIQATVRAQAFFDPEPDRCLSRANTLIYRSTDARTFISLFYGILDMRANTFTYANAGHTLPILLAAPDRHLILRNHGIALGLREEASYQKEVLTLRPGDTLLIYSDGILDAMDDRREQFGEERLLRLLLASRGETSTALLDKLFRAVNSHVGTNAENDDMTALAVRRV